MLEVSAPGPTKQLCSQPLVANSKILLMQDTGQNAYQATSQVYLHRLSFRRTCIQLLLEAKHILPPFHAEALLPKAKCSQTRHLDILIQA